MNIIVCLMIVSVFSVDYLVRELGLLPRFVSWLPECLSIAAIAIIVVRAPATKTLSIHYKYVALFVMFALHILVGIILNTVQPGVIFAGLRTYFKYMPFFLLPAVYEFSEDEVWLQLRLILALVLLQCPLVLYQRFVQFAGRNTGDYISGTLTISSILSIVLISAMAVLFAFYLRKRMSFRRLLILLVFLFIPTTLNETKGTLFLIPLAVIVPGLLFGVAQRKLSAMMPLVLVGGLLMGGFVVLFNQSLGQMEERNIAEDVMGEGLKSYLYKEATGDHPSFERVGKIDSVVLAFKTLSDDPIQLAVGLGVGNVTDSFSEHLQGAYWEEFTHLGPKTTAISFLLWHVGLIGVVLVFTGCYLIFSDARYLSRVEGMAGTLALGWAAVVVIYLVSLGYKNIISFNSIGYLFWYLSGYVAATRLRWEQGGVRSA